MDQIIGKEHHKFATIIYHAFIIEIDRLVKLHISPYLYYTLGCVMCMDRVGGFFQSNSNLLGWEISSNSTHTRVETNPT